MEQKDAFNHLSARAPSAFRLLMFKRISSHDDSIFPAHRISTHCRDEPAINTLHVPEYTFIG
jgi:hypothetical protein